MTNKSPNHESLSANKQALLKIRELKQQLADARAQKSEDIAIVSMACRFPRRSIDPEAFWESLMEGRDEVSEIPEDRWELDAFYDEDPEIPGKMYARHGVFLDDLQQMDPEFFGIAPREATWVDPQQRLLLEVGWEALERACWSADGLGRGTGIFVGWMHNDYQNEASDSFLNLNPYIATGAAGSFLCGRLAYYLGLEGPSVAVDTACSSSLVALHLACQSLHRRDCDRALVGAVNAILSPTTNILTCKLKALSPSGHSRAFDAQADGYLRGEGCGVLALRRLSDAQRDGDPVLAVIKGTSVGHNGFSSGLTAPNPSAQERVIREALDRAEVHPNEIGYLEAHGTGTELGDPIEMQAAAAALAKERTEDNPLLVGSVKTNIGHLEAAAGMAGIIKVLLAIQHNKIPGQLNFDEPNPHIPWEQIPVKVLQSPTDWPNQTRRIAGVSAFGMSGTNAHVVIEGPPANTNRRDSKAAGDRLILNRSQSSDSDHLIVLSGKTEETVHQLAGRYGAWLSQHPDARLADIAHTTGVGRQHFEYRAAIVAKTHDEARSRLDRLSRAGSNAGLYSGHHRSTPRIAWQFTGQGSQYLGMAKGLYESEPIFREAIDECSHLISQWRKRSLVEVMFQDEAALNHTSWTQPALFAMQKGLVRLLQSWGLKPDAVMGHSVGQYAAACVAGMMSWDDGLWLISERGRLIGELPSGGAMLAVFVPTDQIQEILSSHPTVSLAASNGSHLVVSGPETEIASIADELGERGVRTKRLTTSHAFHSSLMEPALDEFQAIADKIDFMSPQLPIVCNISGEMLTPDTIVDGSYWRNHIREAVRYAESVRSLRDSGCELLLELGPHPVLTTMAASVWDGANDRLVGCLHREASDRKSVMSAIAQLFVHGVTPQFANLSEDLTARRIVLPTYPFQRRKFWGPDKPRAYHATFHTEHPLVGGKCSLAGLPNEERFESRIAPDSPPWLPDHLVMGQVVYPGAAWVEMALAVADGKAIAQLSFEQPLQPRSRTILQSILRKGEDGQQSLELYSSPEESSHWTRHVSALIDEMVPESRTPIDRGTIESNCPHEVQPSDFYQTMQEHGLEYGPQFQTVDSLRYSDTEVLAHLRTIGDMRGYIIPPNLLDGAFHALAVGLMRGTDTSLFLPIGMDRIECYRTVEDSFWCHATWTQSEGPLRTADLTLFDESGEVVAKISNLKIRQLDRAALRQVSGAGAERLVYGLRWRQHRLPANDEGSRRWLVVSNRASDKDQSSISDQVSGQLEDLGHQVKQVYLSAESLSETTEVVSGEVAVDDLQGWDKQLEAFDPDDQKLGPQGIVWILNGDKYDLRTHCTGVLGLLRSLRSTGIAQLECGLQFVTQNAVAPSDANSEIFDGLDSYQSSYWGLGRVVGAEHPEYRCRVIDIEVRGQSKPLDDLASLCELITNSTSEGQFAVRQQQLLVPRLVESRLTREPSPDQRFSAASDGAYLITGGLGVLGRHAAHWLAEKGAGHVVLVSRRPPDQSMLAFVEEIEGSGCSVTVHQADLSNDEDGRRLVARFGDDLPVLRGVIHAAGVLDDALLGDQNWERFEKVLKPKVAGASLLDELTSDIDLDFFVLYSSAASVLGSPGQSNYATANAYLDGLAWRRRNEGKHALSINWGPWSAGMADDENIVKRLSLQGITPLSIAEAHQAMERMLEAGLVQATVMDVDWSRMRMGMGSETPPLLQEVTPSQKRARTGDSELVEKLRKLSLDDRRSLLISTIQTELQEILSTPDSPEVDRPLIEMGLDSLMAVEFGVRLQGHLGDDFAVAPTMLFDHPTIDAITDHILETINALGGSAEEPSVEDSQEVAARVVEREDIAVVGMNCRFPGANDVGEFWDNLLNGVDSVCDIPDDRWDVDEFFDPTPQPGKMYTKQGGFLSDIANFDAEFFNISDQEACWIDPQHRMLLEVSWRALEDAGIQAQPIEDKNVGVFMGIMSQDYAFLPKLGDVDVIEAFQGAGLAHSAGVGRISYVFGFEGPSIAVDTASSSSLVAVCQAVKSLQDHNCNMALAGGVNAILAPANSLLMSKAGLLAPDGRCKSFSANADGFGRGEGCGVVVLKRLSDAERDGDRVMAVIRGGAVSHNGFSGGITSPSSRSQVRTITEALESAKIPPSEVQYLEAHGTGTEFGDPMEIGAAASVLGKGRAPDHPLLVGSVKANISHLEAAGGVSGLIKTILAIHHGIIPKQIHCEAPSPHVPWEKLPVRIVNENTPWPETEERIAGVTALGLSGTNAHVVVSSSPMTNQVESSNPDPTAHLLTISAPNEIALQELAQKYCQFLVESPAVDLGDLCHTAAFGRKHFDHRATFLMDSTQAGAKSLAAFAAKPASRADVSHSGNGSPSATTPDAGLVSHGCASRSPKIAWAFLGQVGDALDCAQQLYREAPVFRDSIEHFDQVTREFIGEQDHSLDHTELGQQLSASPSDSPASIPDEIVLFAVQASLARLWQSWGIEPEFVLGMGVGQLAATAMAGGVGMDDAMRLVVERQIVLQQFANRGATESERRKLEQDDSDLKEALDRFETMADKLNYFPPDRSLVCSLTGDVLPIHRIMGGSYWRRHIIEPPSWQAMASALTDSGCDWVLELSPHALLGHEERYPLASEAPNLLQSLSTEQTAMTTMLRSLGQLYVDGANPDFKSMSLPWKRRRLSLPSYPFQRKRYWITELGQFV